MSGQGVSMRRVLASAAIVVALAGCGSTATHKPPSATTSPAMLTTLQACQQLRADQVANGGTPDVPTLQRLIKRLLPTGVKSCGVVCRWLTRDPWPGLCAERWQAGFGVHLRG